MKYSQADIAELKKALVSAKEIGDDELAKMLSEQIAEIEAEMERANIKDLEKVNCSKDQQEIQKLKKKISELEQKKATTEVKSNLPTVVSKSKKQPKKTTTKPSGKVIALPSSQSQNKLPAIVSKQTKQQANKAKVKKEPKAVLNISEQVRIIKRFVNLMSSKGKTKKALENLLLAIKKAFLLKKITPSMPYYEVVKDIEKILVKATQSNGDVEISVSQNDMENLKDIASSEKRLLSATYLNSYFNLARSDKQDKVKMKKLAEKIGNALKEGYIKQNDMYYKEVRRAFGKLNSGEIKLNADELAGLSEICSCGKTLAGVEIDAETLQNTQIETLGFEGIWKDFLGDVAKPFSMVIFGLPKTGKTYLSLMFADYLSRNFGKVLYVSAEEFGSPTLVRKVQDLDLHKDIVFRASCPDDVSQYDFVFVDSVNRANIEVEKAEKMKNQNSNTSFIWLLQATKEGNFRGSQEWTHNADIIVKVDENNTATAQGRYGGGQMNVFEVIDYAE